LILLLKSIVLAVIYKLDDIFRIVLLFSLNKIINELILLKVDNLFRLNFNISKLLKLKFLQDKGFLLRIFILDLRCCFRIKR